MARKPKSRIALRKNSTTRTRVGQKKKFNLIVAGDVFIDHHLYKGKRDVPVKDPESGVRDVCEPGGAAILVKLLQRVFAAKRILWNVYPSLGENAAGDHGYAYWSPFLKSKDEEDKKEKDRTRVWRVELAMGYGQPTAPARSSATQAPSGVPRKADILLLDDAGSRFRHQAKKLWLLPADENTRLRWIVVKMSQPIGQGALWHELVLRFSDRLVCVVSVDELRRECVKISRGLSWERTVEEVRDALLQSSSLTSLTKCAHLIVRFASDGALWLDCTDSNDPKARLVFDAGGSEGEWKESREGSVVGSSTAFAAAIVYGLTQRISNAGRSNDRDVMTSAIKSGLAAVRDLEDGGHGVFGETPPEGFPAQRLASIIKATGHEFADADVPWQKLPDPGRLWMIVEESERTGGPEAYRYRPLVGLAREVVLHGEPALDPYPHARFGKLIAIDRLEIELLRSVRRLMVAYKKNDKADKPLSVGVFGPPGAGKSFGVKQLAKEIFGDKAWLEFNLSQFNGPTDLVGAFHQVRDKVLSGVTPVVFWDEFDSREYFWLQYLLAPMQDGRFQHDQLSHWIGKCVFIFAGGTSSKYEEFAPGTLSLQAPDHVLTAFKLKKGPDFHSRLDGYYNVVGPNQRAKPRWRWGPNLEPDPDPKDVCFPLRRALLIRSSLNCKADQRLDFDSDLIDALLLAPKFRHGARSLEKLISELGSKGGGPIRRSALLAAPLRGMHVDEKAFDELLKRNDQYRRSRQIEDLAQKIHEFWRGLSRKQGWTMQTHLNKPYNRLAPIDKEDNRAAARRIPEILSLVGLDLAGPAPATPDESPIKYSAAKNYLMSPRRIERLAEAEHDGWMEQRLKNGWLLGSPRDDRRRIHPLLVPYSELPAREKKKDRNTIRHIPEMIKQAGYRIVWLRN